MSGTALIDYTVLISSPQILTRIPGVGARVPPSYNVIISNVPGPRQRLYFLGAEMEAYYPISALVHGQALNITVLSYAGGLYFGFTACLDRVPSVQRGFPLRPPGSNSPAFGPLNYTQIVRRGYAVPNMWWDHPRSAQ